MERRYISAQNPGARRLRPDRAASSRDDLRARGFHVDRLSRGKLLASQKERRASISSCQSCRWKRPRWRGCCATATSMSSSIASACCRTAPAATRPRVHRDFVARLLQAIRDSGRAIRLVHISIPGDADDDRTAFSTTKREAERLIADSGYRLRDPAAGFRGGARGLWRQRHAARAGGVSARTAGREAGRRRSSRSPSRISPRPSPGLPRAILTRRARVTWDLMQPRADHARRRDRPIPPVVRHRRMAAHHACPRFLLDLGAKLGDLANLLGWMPPMRTTAIAELRRGVSGDPARWMTATGIVPKTHRADSRTAPGDHSGQMVCAAVPDQGAGHRKPRAVLGGVRLHRAGGLLLRRGRKS